MADRVKTRRPYDAPQRREQAADTRRAVLAAARDLFTVRGYDGTTVAQVAATAGVAVDTVYAVGRKPQLLREVVETAISGEDRAVPAERRAYVAAVRAAPTAAAKIATYARAVAEMAPRTGPVLLALRDAAARDPQCAQHHQDIRQRRAANMLLFAGDLRATGELRPDLSDAEIADVVWSMNAAEYHALLAERGWSAERYGAHLADTWCRLFLVRT